MSATDPTAGLDHVLACLARFEPEPAPAALEDRIRMRLKDPSRSAPTPIREAVRERIVLSCTYCHAQLAKPEGAYCATCLAPHHRACFDEHGRCSAPGCDGDDVVVPSRAARPARPRWAALLAGAALAGVGAVAAWTVSQVAPEAPRPAPVTHSAPPAPLEPPAPAPVEPLPRQSSGWRSEGATRAVAELCAEHGVVLSLLEIEPDGLGFQADVPVGGQQRLADLQAALANDPFIAPWVAPVGDWVWEVREVGDTLHLDCELTPRDPDRIDRAHAREHLQSLLAESGAEVHAVIWETRSLTVGVTLPGRDLAHVARLRESLRSDLLLQRWFQPATIDQVRVRDVEDAEVMEFEVRLEIR